MLKYRRKEMVEYPKNFKKDSLKYLGLSVDMRKKENKALGKEGVINNILNKRNICINRCTYIYLLVKKMF